MDDGLAQGAWRIDADTRTAMRLDRVRAASRDCAWRDVILEAEELLDEVPDHPEALGLLGEALLEVSDWELADQVFDHRLSLDGGDPDALSGRAASAFHLADLSTATECAREAIRRDPGNARGHYHLGLALERIPGRGGDAATELMAAAQLDPARFPLPVVVKHAEWEGLIGRAVAQLPGRLQAFYRNVAFRVEDLPDLDELLDHTPPLSPGVGALYVGRPPDAPFDQPPTAIRLFARNLCRSGSTDAAVVELVHALREEALDWLGLDLESLEAEP